MAGETDRFRFTTLNDSTDRVDTGDWKFGTGDRAALDRLLGYVVERHRHDGSITPNDDLAAPILFVHVSGGVLPAGTTVYYRYVIVDAVGQESAPSAVAVAHLPLSVMTPRPPTLAVAASVGSTLMPGLYQYAVSALSDSSSLNSHQTLCSPPVLIQVAAGQAVLITTPTPPSGATSFNIYRKGPTDPELCYITSVGVDGGPVTDDGMGGDRHRLIPVANTTYSTNAVSIELPVPPPVDATVKIFRTFTPITWDSTLLDWNFGIATDTGHQTQFGSPSSVRENVNGAAKIDLGVDTEGMLPPRLVTVPFEARFELAGPVVEGLGPYLWVCDVDYAEIVSARAWLARGSTPDELAVITTLDCQRQGVGAWVEVFAVDRPMVRVGETVGEQVVVDPSTPNSSFVAGDALRLRVVQAGGGTGTDTDLTLAVTFYVRHGSAIESHDWETP